MQKNSLLQFTILLIVCFIAVRSCISEKKENTDLKQSVQVAINDSTHFYKDRYDREHAQRELLQANLATVNIFNGNMLDSIAKGLNTLKSNIQSSAAVSVNSSNKVIPIIDTVLRSNKKAIHFLYSDKWINIDGVLLDTPFLSYITYDSLIVTTYNKRIGFLKKATFLDAYSLNPNSRIRGLTGFRIPSGKPKRFSVGPYIGYGYSGIKFQPSIGLSLQYSLIRF